MSEEERREEVKRTWDAERPRALAHFAEQASGWRFSPRRTFTAMPPYRPEHTAWRGPNEAECVAREVTFNGRIDLTADKLLTVAVDAEGVDLGWHVLPPSPKDREE